MLLPIRHDVLNLAKIDPEDRTTNPAHAPHIFVFFVFLRSISINKGHLVPRETFFPPAASKREKGLAKLRQSAGSPAVRQRGYERVERVEDEGTK